MADVVEELITRLTVDASSLIQNIKTSQTLVESMKAALRSLADQTKSSFKDAGQALLNAIREAKTGGDLTKLFPNLKDFFPDISTNVNRLSQAKAMLVQSVRQASTELNKETKELQNNAGATNQNTTATSKLNDIVRLAFGVGIGQIAYQALRSFTTLLKESVQSGYEFTKAIYQLAVGTNALRRAGIDIHLADIYANLDKLQKKFGIFSKKELVEGAAAFMNLVRDMGFTKEQIFELQDAVATLAVVNGRAMDDVQRTVALALSSGYTEGLQRLGVSINRVNIALKAEELGYGRVYMTLTETQRAEATQILLLEKTARYADDLTSYQETLAGAIDKTTASITDLKTAMGTASLDIKKVWLDLVEFMLKGVLTLTQMLSTAAAEFKAFKAQIGVDKPEFSSTYKTPQDAYKAMSAAGVSDMKLWDEYGKRATEYYKEMEDYNKKIGDSTKTFAEDLKRIWGSMPDANVDEAGLGDAMTDAQIKEEEAANKRMDVMEKMLREMYDLDEETRKELLDAWEKYQDDITRIDQETADKRSEIQESWRKKIQDINRDMRGDIKSVQDKYNLDVIQTNRQYNIKREEAEAKYREKQIKAEIDYQEKLQKLREGFMMDLDEALHERDARQILRLIKQYNLQKEQAGRDYKIQLDEMKRAHQLELQEMENARKERLRILYEEMMARIKAIQEEARLKREQARADRDAKLAELDEESRLEKEKRDAKYKQELEDIEQNAQDKANQIVKGLVEEYELTKPELEKIAKLWEAVYGKKGRIPNALDYTVKYIAAVNKMLTDYQTKLDALSGKGTNPKARVSPYGNRRAAGGVDIATSPTNLTIGDAGPEVAMTFPLTRAFSGNQYLNGNPVSSLSGGGSGEVEIAVSLSPDLVGQIVKKSGDTVANVMLEIQRQR